MHQQPTYPPPAPRATQQALPVPWRIWATATATQACDCGAPPGIECACAPGCHLVRIAYAWLSRRGLITKGDMQMVLEAALDGRGYARLKAVPGCAA